MTFTLGFVTGLVLVLSVGSNNIITPAKLQADTIRKEFNFHPFFKFENSKEENIKDSPRSLGVNVSKTTTYLPVYYKGYFTCGATALSEEWIITAANCVFERDNSELSVLTGTNNLNDPNGKLTSVRQVIIHPNYDNETKANDYAILSVNASLGENIKPMSYSLLTPRPGSLGTVYTCSYERESPSGIRMHQVNVSVVDQRTCRDLYNGTGNITGQMICAVAGTSGPCFANPGDPLMVDGALAGVYSWSTDCNQTGLPAVLSSILTVKDWILKQIED